MAVLQASALWICAPQPVYGIKSKNAWISAWWALRSNRATPENCAGAILYPLYAACQDYGLIMHITTNIYSAPNALWSAPAYIDQVAADFPELRIVVGHASHPHVHELCGIAYWRPNIYLCPGVYLPHAIFSATYVEAANDYLGEQLLFGSTYPVASFASVLDGYKRAGFKDSVIDNVLFNNAKKLYKF